MGEKWLYLHGFASGPESAKGRGVSEHYRGKVAIERLNLRLPSLEHLRLSAMMAHVRASIGANRAVLFGSSLGGLTAARVAEEDERVRALVLLAPAFRIAERWRRRIGGEAWARWQREDALEVDDHVTGGKARVDFGFIEEAGRIDARNGGWPDVRVPTLVVHGTRDETVGIDCSREWARARDNVRLIEVDDGHELVASLPLICAESERFLAPFLHDVSRAP